MWIILAASSALFLGIYDINRKKSLENNAVIPVLFLSTLTGAIIFAPFIIVSAFTPWLDDTFFHVPFNGTRVHAFIFLKAIIVSSSWILSFFAIKHLPLTITSPIRSTAPVWTLLGALIFFGEKLTSLQWVGLVVSLVFFYLFTLSGHADGISPKKNKWLWFIVGGTLLGSVSALFDKYLVCHFDKMEIQAWFSIYQVIVLLPILLLLWMPGRKKSTPFRWSNNIPLIATFLVIADFTYLWALSLPGALISLISTIRRSNVIVSYSAGIFIFKEKINKRRLFFLLGIMAGIIIMYVGS
jgi:transporter family protein